MSIVSFLNRKFEKKDNVAKHHDVTIFFVHDDDGRSFKRLYYFYAGSVVIQKIFFLITVKNCIRLRLMTHVCDNMTDEPTVLRAAKTLVSLFTNPSPFSLQHEKLAARDAIEPDRTVSRSKSPSATRSLSLVYMLTMEFDFVGRLGILASTPVTSESTNDERRTSFYEAMMTFARLYACTRATYEVFKNHSGMEACVSYVASQIFGVDYMSQKNLPFEIPASDLRTLERRDDINRPFCSIRSTVDKNDTVEESEEDVIYGDDSNDDEFSYHENATSDDDDDDNVDDDDDDDDVKMEDFSNGLVDYEYSDDENDDYDNYDYGCCAIDSHPKGHSMEKNNYSMSSSLSLESPRRVTRHYVRRNGSNLNESYKARRKGSEIGRSQMRRHFRPSPGASRGIRKNTCDRISLIERKRRFSFTSTDHQKKREREKMASLVSRIFDSPEEMNRKREAANKIIAEMNIRPHLNHDDVPVLIQCNPNTGEHHIVVLPDSMEVYWIGSKHVNTLIPQFNQPHMKTALMNALC